MNQHHDRVYDTDFVLLEGKEFASIEELGPYISEVVNTRWMRNRGWNFYRWEVRDGCGTQARCRVDAGTCTLIFPSGTRNQLTVMREVAHALTFEQPGPKFCALYVSCVRRFMGREHAEAIRRAFVVEGPKRRHQKPKWATSIDHIECDVFSESKPSLQSCGARDKSADVPPVNANDVCGQLLGAMDKLATEVCRSEARIVRPATADGGAA